MSHLRRIREAYTFAIVEVAEAFKLVNEITLKTNLEMGSQRLEILADDDELENYLVIACRNMDRIVALSEGTLGQIGLVTNAARVPDQLSTTETLPEMIQQIDDTIQQSQILLGEINQLARQYETERHKWWKVW